MERGPLHVYPWYKHSELVTVVVFDVPFELSYVLGGSALVHPSFSIWMKTNQIFSNLRQPYLLAVTLPLCGMTVK